MARGPLEGPGGDPLLGNGHRGDELSRHHPRRRGPASYRQEAAEEGRHGRGNLVPLSQPAREPRVQGLRGEAHHGPEGEPDQERRGHPGDDQERQPHQDT